MGAILAFWRPFKIGDIIEVKEIMGTVSKTDLRVTVLQTFKGQEVYIPNKDILEGAIHNYSISKKSALIYPLAFLTLKILIK